MYHCTPNFDIKNRNIALIYVYENCAVSGTCRDKGLLGLCIKVDPEIYNNLEITFRHNGV